VVPLSHNSLCSTLTRLTLKRVCVGACVCVFQGSSFCVLVFAPRVLYRNDPHATYNTPNRAPVVKLRAPQMQCRTYSFLRSKPYVCGRVCVLNQDRKGKFCLIQSLSLIQMNHTQLVTHQSALPYSMWNTYNAFPTSRCGPKRVCERVCVWVCVCSIKVGRETSVSCTFYS
jgi:hypothetical protein